MRLCECFVLETTARAAADLLGVQANTAALFYHKLRWLIASKMAESEPELGVFECDESYFGGVRKGKRGRGAAGKVCVFGILKRGGKVYALPIADASSNTLLTALPTKVLADSVVSTDRVPSDNILDIAGFKHRRVNHSKTFVSRRDHHINGIETFWNQSKRVLRKYNGIPRKHFFLFLKECEFRFNYGSPNQQLAQLRKWAKL
ncbi:MAG: IS1595 family transposase [Nitrospira sp.]|nr:IS1595 family transposase [Nitrospira sp.]